MDFMFSPDFPIKTGKSGTRVPSSERAHGRWENHIARCLQQERQDFEKKRALNQENQESQPGGEPEGLEVSMWFENGFA